MGSICCNVNDDTNFTSNYMEFKSRLIDEYKSYLSFLNKLKQNFNSSMIKDDTNNNVVEKFYLVPRTWFENWEKRIVSLYVKNKYKYYDYNYEFKNEGNLPKFYYDIIPEELWIKFYRNQLYKLNGNNAKTKNGMICNNLIILQYLEKFSNIEIFFFEKDDDYYFTNLLFSFENCNSQTVETEYYNILNLLKSSPIQEILGNMHYDKSKEFNVKNSKMIIYNKTIINDEEFKNFRTKQYDILFINPIQEIDECEEKDKDNDNDNVNNGQRIYGYLEINNNINNVINYDLIGNSNNINAESTFGYNITQGNTGIKKNRRYISSFDNNNLKNIKVFQNNNKNDNNKNLILTLNNNSLIKTKITDEFKKNSRNFLLKSNLEISTISENKTKISNIFDFYEEHKSNQNLFESILYCLFNIKQLVEYLLNNKENDKIPKNSFYTEILKIIEFLFKKNKTFIDKLNKNKSNNIYEIVDDYKDEPKVEEENNLINLCPDYNYQKILRFVIFQNSINIISKVINTLHLELNKSSKPNDYRTIQNEISEEIINPNEEEKNNKYKQFIDECKENNNSIIFDLFFGVKESKIICNKCDKFFYKYEIFNVIEFSLDKLGEYIKEKNNENNNINNSNDNDNSKINVSTIDCLDYYFSRHKIANNVTNINCTFCNEYHDFSIINKICKYPEILIMCFNYDNDISLENGCNTKIDFDDIIKSDNNKYILKGVISRNDENNVYNSYCRDDSNKNWIFYDIKKINNYDLLKNKDHIFPIVLFYQKLINN